jgi:hypothetical protein
MSDELEERLPSVETLSGRSFFVPDYQRGYRWTPDEVRDLLGDIRDFATKAKGAEDYYCLQPLVVQQMESGQWVVIDGQQRLTTIFLITRYVNDMWIGQKKDREVHLDYESRERTREFLANLKLKDGSSVDFNDENIDFAHISKAYQTIHEWVENEAQTLNRYQFMDVFRHQVRVIWYEPEGGDPVKIFTRINRGKIPLTNAELIRALFLKGSNFTKAGATAQEEESGQLRQMEIAGEWDRMEAALHDDHFWFFLTDPKDPAKTRIDLIFRLLTGIEGDDSYALFRKYAKDFPREPETAAVMAEWNNVKACFQQLKDWHEDWELYHLIGYLIETGTPLKGLWEESRGLRKSEFKVRLKSRIRKTIPEKDRDKLEYGNASIRRILLLHNVLTTLGSGERHFRFPLNRHKQEGWDVEHIHSVAEKPPETETHQREWLSEAAGFLTDKTLKKNVTALLEKQKWGQGEFDSFYKEVLRSFSEKGEIESINDLSNLALLDKGTNRGYGNAVFPVKRAKIIEREREGKFVPIATKNAFMKYYTASVEKFTFWSEADRQGYFEAMEETIEAFFKAEKGAEQ